MGNAYGTVQATCSGDTYTVTDTGSAYSGGEVSVCTVKVDD